MRPTHRQQFDPILPTWQAVGQWLVSYPMLCLCKRGEEHHAYKQANRFHDNDFRLFHAKVGIKNDVVELNLKVIEPKIFL